MKMYDDITANRLVDIVVLSTTSGDEEGVASFDSDGDRRPANR